MVVVLLDAAEGMVDRNYLLFKVKVRARQVVWEDTFLLSFLPGSEASE